MPQKAKLPPHDIELEQVVLSSILIDSEALIKVSDFLTDDCFYDKSHRLIYQAMIELYEKREPIDVVTLTNHLKKKRKLTAVGGASKIAKLSNIVSTSANVKSHARLVKGHAVRRQLISLAGEMSEAALNESGEAKEIINEVEQKIYAISQAESKRNFIPLRDTLVESFERIDELQKTGSDLRGVPTGFNDLDRLLAGMQKSNLLILAARPGMGKTAFSLNITQNMVVQAKKKVGFFSLEMSREELVDRLLVGQADIDAWKLKTGRLDQQDFLKLSDAMGVLAEAELYIDDTPGLSIFEMRTKARRLMSEYNVDLLVVDYLQLAHGRTKDNRVQEVAEISQGLKNIARELRVPVLALSQLSRAIESRGEKNPQLSDLRESGSIEQDADVVMFLYRKDDDIRESVTLKVAKHRNGPLGELELFFKGDRIKFFGMEKNLKR
ncbi:MAG: replicative DNA helicase [Candidatus Woesebacteria bacterium]|jgi:replicative DNA helicase